MLSPEECLSPRVRLECNPEIPVAPGEEHWLLDPSLEDGLTLLWAWPGETATPPEIPET